MNRFDIPALQDKDEKCDENCKEKYAEENEDENMKNGSNSTLPKGRRMMK